MDINDVHVISDAEWRAMPEEAVVDVEYGADLEDESDILTAVDLLGQTLGHFQQLLTLDKKKTFLSRKQRKSLNTIVEEVSEFLGYWDVESDATPQPTLDPMWVREPVITTLLSMAGKAQE